MIDKKDETPTINEKVRIGIILGPLGRLNLSALRYFIIHLNTLQGSFEYEILPHDADDVFIKQLASKSVDQKKVKRQVDKFLGRYKKFLKSQIAKFKLKEQPPDLFILLSTAKFSNNYYFMSTKGLSILALGNWKRSMAPPSIVEFFMVLILRASVPLACPSLGRYVHLGTKGCLFDFTKYLDEVRYKVLNGFICKKCSTTLLNGRYQQLRDDLLFVLRKEWLGTPDDLGSPANIMAKLGYNLFLTKGLKRNAWETFLAAIQQEGTKQLIKIVGTIVLTGLLIWLGLRVG